MEYLQLELADSEIVNRVCVKLNVNVAHIYL